MVVTTEALRPAEELEADQRARWAGPRWPSLGPAVGLVLGAVAFLIGSRAIGDNSFLTHLATGRLILDDLAVPTRDVYSATAGGEPWVVQSWLASALYAAAERTVGLPAVRVLHGMLAVGVLATVWTLTRPVRSLVVRVVLVAAPLGVGATFWSPRPLLFGLVATGLVLVVLAGHLAPLWLLPVFAVWGATHGSFPIGLALLAAAAAGAWLDERRIPERELRALVWALSGTLTIVAGPLGLDGLLFPLRLLAKQDVLAEVVEWKPPTYHSPGELLYVALLLGVAAVFTRRGAQWRALLPAAMAVGMGLLAVRNLPTSSLVLVAAVVPTLAAAGGRGGLDPQDRGVVAKAMAVAAVVLGVTGATTVLSSDALELGRFPVEEVRALDDAGLVAEPRVRLLTHDYVGNYLTLRYGTAAQVFLDDRFDMYPADVVADYVTAFRGGDIEAVLDRWRPDVVLWQRDAVLRHWLDAHDGWDLVHEDGDYVVFCRADSPARSRCP